MTTNDGGPAFPVNQLVTMHGEIVAGGSQGGMTLRDYFAAKAMAGLLADPSDDESNDEYRRDIAVAAYKVADAMIAARGEK